MFVFKTNKQTYKLVSPTLCAVNNKKEINTFTKTFAEVSIKEQNFATNSVSRYEVAASSVCSFM